MEHHGFGYPATDAEGATTVQPERDLQPADDLSGAAPADEKKGIAGRVKGMMGRHSRKKHGVHKNGTDTPEAATKGGILGKIKGKAGSKVGHGDDGSKRGPVRLLSMSSSSSSMSSSDDEHMGTVGFAMDPTGPAVAGSTLGRQDFSSAPQGPGADFSDLNLNKDANGEMDRHSKLAAEYAKSSNPMNSNYSEPRPTHLTESSDHSHPTETGNSDVTPSEDAFRSSRSKLVENSNQTDEPHPTNPTGMTNPQGGALLGDHHGKDLDEGPRDDNVKQEGFVTKMMDKLKGEHTSTTA